MGKTRKPVYGPNGGSTSDGTARDEAIAAKYESGPSPAALYQEGQIDGQGREQAERVALSGPPARPFRELIAALRTKRERQALSVADIAERTGMDRGAIHKLEIGLNSNSTYATLTRYASALEVGSSGV